MSGTSLPAYRDPSQRVFPRHPLSIPVDLKALQSGIPEDLPGRCTDISESGLGAVVAGELSSGQPVAVELRLPMVGVPVRVRAVVRYQSRLHCGLELVGLSADQRDMIRYWIQQRKTRDEVGSAENIDQATSRFPPVHADSIRSPKAAAGAAYQELLRRIGRPRIRHRAYAIAAGLIVIALAIAWLRWEKSWHELERQSYSSNSVTRVSEETMASRVVTRIDPVYPEAAKKLKTQGWVVLDAVIAANGSVEKLRALSGPEMFVPAATTAVSSWKFEPYFSNGRAVPVETTISVEFHVGDDHSNVSDRSNLSPR